MKIVAGMGAAMAAAMAAVVAGETKVLPKKKPVKRRQRAKITPAPKYVNPFSRSTYIPGGPYRNCGDRGISPKKVRG